MDLTDKEIQGSYKWLFVAGSAAIALSAFLFYVDNVVMENAPQRDREQAAQMRELRMAQSSLPAGVTDSRQTLPLDIEADDKSQADADHHADAHGAVAHEDEDDHDHGDHGDHGDHHH
jgi:hypothetical protein